MPYIKYLKLVGFKGVDRVTYTLGPKTLVVGPRGAGKTRINWGLRAAALGNIPTYPLVGSDIMELAPDGANLLNATAVLNNGEECSFTVTGSTAKASKPQHDPSFTTRIVSDIVDDIFGGNPAKTRSAVMQVCADKVDLASLAEGLDEGAMKIWSTMLSRSGHPDVAKRVEDAEKMLKADITRVKRETEYAESRYQNLLATPNDGVLDPDDFAATSAKLSEAKAALQERRRVQRQQSGMSASEIEGELARLKHEGKAIVREHGKRDPKVLQDKLLLAEALTKARAAVLAHGNPEKPCPLCGEGGYEGIESRSERSIIRKLDVAIAAMRRLQTIKREGKQLMNLTPGEDDPELDRLSKLVTGLDLKLSAHNAAVAAKESLAEIEQELPGLREQLLRREGLRDQVKRKKTEVLEGPAREVIEHDSNLALTVFDGRREVWRVSMKQGGAYVPWRALSGTQGADAKVEAARIVGRTVQADLRLYLSDDEARYSDGFPEYIEALSSLSTEHGIDQVVVCSPTDYWDGSDPEGWTVIRL